MNFLAHLYLSSDSKQIMVGNFIADFANADEIKSYQNEIKLGIRLHREIDSFTNKHSLFTRSKQRLWRRHRHYSSVIVDIFYDHFLAKNWGEYSRMPLEDFAHKSYATIQLYDNILPQKARQVLPHMIANNWLVNYKKISGIDRAMQGMARRASFPSAMAEAIEDLQHNYEDFEKDFDEFFPELMAYSTACLQTILDSDSMDKKQS